MGLFWMSEMASVVINLFPLRVLTVKLACSPSAETEHEEAWFQSEKES